MQIVQQVTELEDIILKLYERTTSVFTITFGRRETGKTDFNYLIDEILAKYNVIEMFATNGKIYQSSFPIERITDLETLESWCQSSTKRKKFTFDEMGKSLRRRTPMSKLNISLIDKLQILRKYRLSIAGITPAETYIDNASMGSDVLDAIFVKPYFKNPKIVLFKDLLENKQIWLTGIPRTSIKYDTYDIAPFTLSQNKLPTFKDKDIQNLWEWSNGKTSKELGLHSMQLNRILKNFVKKVLERDSHSSHIQALEDNSLNTTVTE